jgi:hypothetical protein
VIRTATILLFFAYLTGLCAASPTGAPDPDETIRSAVKIIEDSYLYTRSNTFWNAAKERLLKGGYKDQEGACRGLSRELATIADSELPSRQFIEGTAQLPWSAPAKRRQLPGKAPPLPSSLLRVLTPTR